jgi:hypothetical protein
MLKSSISCFSIFGLVCYFAGYCGFGELVLAIGHDLGCPMNILYE